MYCKHCGAVLESQAKYCSNCGQSTTENTTQTTPPQKPRSGKSPLWFKALLCLVTLIVGGSILEAFMSNDLTDTVEDQLKALRDNKITEAYYDFSSKKFQETTSLELFRDFVKQYPAFSQNKSIHFNDRNVNNHTGTLETVITTTANQKIPVEYKLIKEGDKWKILSIRLEDIINNQKATPKSQGNENHQDNIQNESENKPDSLKFSKFAVGNILDSKGIIEHPSTTFKKDSGDIYLNLYVEQAVEDTRIEIFFQHLDSKSTLPAVYTRISNPGDSVLAFVFSPPKNGWPIGNYQVKAVSSTGIQNSFDFKIE